MCGIVGLPNVGKPTLFNTLAKVSIAAENYPSCTTEPNAGIVELPNPRLTGLAATFSPERVVPAILEFVDIAGLLAGASKSEGLGILFLRHIRCDRRRTLGVACSWLCGCLRLYATSQRRPRLTQGKDSLRCQKAALPERRLMADSVSSRPCQQADLRSLRRC